MGKTNFKDLNRSEEKEKEGLWYFISGRDDGAFHASKSDFVTRLYFPLMNETGLKSFVTPDLKGDICLDYHHYLTIPTVTEDLSRIVNNRNFWVKLKDCKPWSTTGMDAYSKSKKWDGSADTSNVEAAPGYFKVGRYNQFLNIYAETTVFVPANEDAVEISICKIKNRGNKRVTFNLTFAQPLFCRSAEHVRDHRQVTTMMQESYENDYCIYIKPRLHHDENGHRPNYMFYAVLGFDQNGNFPENKWASMYEFLGNGGSLDAPEAVWKNTAAPEYSKSPKSGMEAIAALRFGEETLEHDDEKAFIIIQGIHKNNPNVETWRKKYGSLGKVEKVLLKTHKKWTEHVNRVSFNEEDNSNFSNWMKWVGFQIKCREMFGNSYLPDYGYGKGGRGWRDLWQDLLGLFYYQPEQAKKLMANNLKGVRIDGSNATIIGDNPGEFKADRNDIPRTWCDHGTWPAFVINFYIQQTGDYHVLFLDLPYWKDMHHRRNRTIDKYWNEDYGNQQRTAEGEIYNGTLLEHLLIQNLTGFYNVGQHNNLLLEGADWNDTYDMARKHGESVCFYSFYASNLKRLAVLLTFAFDKGIKQITLLEELLILLDRLPDQQKVNYKSPQNKKERLETYFNRIEHNISGRKMTVDTEQLVSDLKQKYEHIKQHINQNEWIKTNRGYKFYNGHYNNISERVHGEHNLGVRIDLTSQVIPLISEISSKEQTEEIWKSVKGLLHDKSKGGLRLTTDYKELDLNLGRITGFIYGSREHGSKWSQQNIMFMLGLYKNNFIEEGYNVFSELFDLCMDSNTSKMFPCIPSSFDNNNRGTYNYLTGSASWLIYSMITEVYGVKGKYGNLEIFPKLVWNQFSKNRKASVQFKFRAFEMKIIFHNPYTLNWEDYGIDKITINTNETVSSNDVQKSVLIPYKKLKNLCYSHSVNLVEVFLNKI